MDWTKDPEERRLLLNLMDLRGIGSARLRMLIKSYGSPSAVVSKDCAQLQKLPGIDAKLASRIESCSGLGFGNKQLELVARYEATVLTCWDSNYPELLKNVVEPPPVLFTTGKPLKNDSLPISVVGTRSPTTYGKRVTERLVRELVTEGATIVSGFARGIDTVAHTETLKCNGKTIAVLGNGLDVVYPAENFRLVDKMKENGTFVTEFPFGTKPDAMNFPRRNRIIAGLCLGTIVVEARAKSGALITANFALNQNREVFAIPGSIFSAKSLGPNKLLQEGAKLVLGINDILDELPVQGDLFRNNIQDTKEISTLTEAEKQVLAHLKTESIHIDELSLGVEMSLPSLLAILLKLEFAGYVKQGPGKMFSRDVQV